MTVNDKIIRVKSTRIFGVIIFVTATFPIFFMFLTFGLNLSFLLTTLLMVIVFTIGIYYLIKYMKRHEDNFEIIADKNSITINNDKRYYWKDIDKIETYSRIPFGHSFPKRYIKLILKNDETIVLNATNYDIWYKDLQKELISFMTNNNKA